MPRITTAITIIGLILLIPLILALRSLSPVKADVTPKLAVVDPGKTILWTTWRLEEVGYRAQSLAKFWGAVAAIAFDPAAQDEKLVIDGSGQMLGRLQGPVPTKTSPYGELLLADCVQETFGPKSNGGVFFVYNLGNETFHQALTKYIYWLRLDDVPVVPLTCQ